MDLLAVLLSTVIVVVAGIAVPAVAYLVDAVARPRSNLPPQPVYFTGMFCLRRSLGIDAVLPAWIVSRALTSPEW